MHRGYAQLYSLESLTLHQVRLSHVSLSGGEFRERDVVEEALLRRWSRPGATAGRRTQSTLLRARQMVVSRPLQISGKVFLLLSTFPEILKLGHRHTDGQTEKETKEAVELVTDAQTRSSLR